MPSQSYPSSVWPALPPSTPENLIQIEEPTYRSYFLPESPKKETSHPSFFLPEPSKEKIQPTHSDFLNIDNLKIVIESCETLHGDRCNQRNFKHPHNLILIDVIRKCITPVTQTATPIRYVALSYVWGRIHQQPLMLTLENFSDLSVPGSLQGYVLPETIQNAIQLCLDMGEKYLWIDRLCIIQDDAATKHQHIKSMADVYGSAALTIVAAAGLDDKHGLPGTGPHGRYPPTITKNYWDGRGHGFTIDVGKSVWNERAWTYQEYLLSRRCIFFTGYQAYFQCQEGLWCEFYDNGVNRERLRTGQNHLLGCDSAPIEKYTRAVLEYNTRSITFPSDILDAFLGVGTVLAEEMDTSLHHALPESFFQWALLWQHSGSFRWRKGSGHPSWTWLAWEGQIAYPHFQRFDEAVDFYRKDPKLGIVPLKAIDSHFANFRTQKQFLPQLAMYEQQQIPEYALIFTTTVAQLRLTKTDLYGPHLGVSVRDLAGVIAGHLWLDRTANEMEPLNKELVYEVIFIASIAKRTTDSAQSIGRTRVHVMLILRNGDSSSEACRIGVGWMYRYRWEQLPQSTQTIVLV